MISKQEKYQIRSARTRRKLSEHSVVRPRLSVFRSTRYIYAQVIDDAQGKTVAAASSVEKEVRTKGKNLETAKTVGTLVAKRALDKGVKEVCFDRGGHIYHGRIKALAEAAREAGLKF
ncbi:MAG: 50S ribosomal protein L18 [Elusimicrobiales bacterium]|nr:50S ribosomal protein L18 [Elusimicrobiales bacterium]